MLLETYINLLKPWSSVFPQERTYIRGVRHSISGFTGLGRKTLSRSILSSGRSDVDWSGDYYFYSRSPWEAKDLFRNVIKETLQYGYDDYIAIGWDETKIKKTGKKIPWVSYQRDPLSPPFHTNFMLGHRYLQASALLALHQKHDVSSRGIPVGFSMIPRVEKPKKKASEEQWEQYKKAKKKSNMSTYFVEKLEEMRQAYDSAGVINKEMIAVCDGSFANKTVFGSNVERTSRVARCRKDLSLCFESKDSSRKFYGEDKFSPEKIRKDETLKWKSLKIFHGKKWREVDYKEVKDVLWQRGAKRKKLRLIVIRPIPYRKTKKGRTYYRQPAYLLSDNNDMPIELMIQMYFDRWQIEVNHREEKDTLGIGQAQVWSIKSVERQPVFMVAAYSMLLLAGLKAYGVNRTNDYLRLPIWRKKAERPSCLDLVTQLRKELLDKPELSCIFGIKTNAVKLIASAAA